ncbi:MAG TPA: oligoendopeptidase F, partial [Rhizobiales bacterium]|nr:oligoendopeptidase F [Hyphomicrobiales bacterium]
MTTHLTTPFGIGIPHDKTASAAVSPAALGEMPEWDLSDLYSGPDSKELKSDLVRLDEEAGAFQDRYQGALAALTEQGGAALAESIRVFEGMSDRIGRIGSYAGLLYAGDTSDPEHAKFYGDVQEKLTGITTKLLFYPLEFNRLEDGALEAALKDGELAHYAPWIEDLRKEKPYQLSDEIEKLFHEKSISGRGAWNRLFNETMTALRFKIGDEELSLEPTLNRLLDQDGAKRKEASQALSGVFGKNLRLFTLITNTLAKDKEISDRWRGFEDVA